MKQLDLSSNELDQFPLNIKDCPKLRYNTSIIPIHSLFRSFGCIMNKITSIPNAFFTSHKMRDHLQELILNNNPITELSGLIRYLVNLRVLGIAHTKIQELPSQIALLNLKKIVVENTPLQVPKLVTAERGFQAIKDFFREQKESKKLGAKKQQSLEDEDDVGGEEDRLF